MLFLLNKIINLSKPIAHPIEGIDKLEIFLERLLYLPPAQIVLLLP